MVNTLFSVFPNSFETSSTFKDLSALTCDPSGMAWGNETLYVGDKHTKNITQCDYDYMATDVTNCETLLDIGEVLGEAATPGGMAVDENGHLWVAISGEKGAVIEIDPESGEIISTIGKNYLSSIGFTILIFF